MRTQATTMARFVVCVAASLIGMPALLAQNPTGTLIGTVTDDSGASLPGVVVSATSPNLQGARSVQTSGNGDYKLGFLPPGEYQISYELEGFATSVRTVKVSAAQTASSDITMQLAAVTEEIVVSSSMETISETPTVATTYTKDEIEKLPITRTIRSTVALAPGVHTTGPSGNISINGAMSFENLWMVNGVVINENVRGQSLPLFIEDAVQETTTSTAGVSAEYGRFTGGVVSVITKSGGNQFSGSLRANLDNEDWESDQNRQFLALRDGTAFTPNADQINEEYEATLGGPLWTDRIWFFAAGRDRQTTGTDTTSAPTLITYGTGNEQRRVEGKLTAGLTSSHNLIVSYLDRESSSSGSTFGSVLDLASLNEREDPQDIRSVNYTGILSSSFFAEAQYSERHYIIGRGNGGPGPDAERSIESLIPGTLMRHRPTGRRFFSSTFCGSCEETQRDNENLLVKGSYFLTTEKAGSHDIAFGYDQYTDIVFSINHQSGSDFQVWAEEIIIDGSNNVFPVFTAGGVTRIVWWPPFNLDIARPTDFTTNSIFVNDSWQLNDKWSFNVGARYDENDGQDSGGNTTVDDAKVSPRLAASYDLKGDGDLVFNASYGTYVAAIANNRADSTSSGGALGGFAFPYGGPSVNALANGTPDLGCASRGNCVTTTDALRTLYNWYVAGGGSTTLNDNLQFPTPLAFGCVPGATSFVPGTLVSPSADELTVGVTKRLGSKGLARADLIYREWSDFYSNLTIPGETTVANGQTLDITRVGNFGDSVLEREYLGLNIQARYRINERLTLSGNYTLSELEGNIDGETANSGPVAESPFDQPEYSDDAWAFPVGRLAADERHRVRAWAIYDILDTEHHSLNVSLLQNFFSGQPYGVEVAVDTRGFVENPGYAQEPTSVAYWVGNRDAFKSDDITRTDLSLNYAFRWSAFGKSIEMFFQPEVINVFDEDGVLTPNTAVNDAVSGGCTPSCVGFNPFTTRPVEGTHYQLGDLFGQADDERDFQQVRTFRFSVGFRF